ncbi:unnamed protein product [Lymnaea stagnalis]|uniref:Uncharacterized protein n=1 Tax=Lymnaea stagnalis TaxID=6523 RepID=A0AAV2H6H7_LYMST
MEATPDSDIVTPNEGFHEVEVSGENEVEIGEDNDVADLDRVSPSRCQKEACHHKYILTDKLTLCDFPKRYRDRDVLQLAKVLALLTVKVRVGYVSRERPEFSPENLRYPLYTLRGQSIVSCGSGRIWDVEIITPEQNRKCECRGCRASDTPIYAWAYVYVDTATHVVFDNDEAKSTDCWWGYDSPCAPHVILEGVAMKDRNFARDTFRIACVTHDLDLVRRLQGWTREYEELFWEVTNKYDGSEQEVKDNLIIIVSHPHGCYKRVSLGPWESREELSDKRTRYSYTASTCQGTSGAPVFIIGREGWEWYTHAHSWTDNKPGKTSNFSCYRWF